MKRNFITDTIGLFWPPLAPVTSEENLASNQGWWAVTCALSVIPVTAMLHHGVCYYHQCMFGPFSTGDEFTWPVVWNWLRHDPSLPWAVIAALIAHTMGRRFAAVKIVVAPLFLSFLLVSLWVWDIFFLHWPMARHFHNERFELWQEFPLKGRHFYVLGACLHIAFTVYLLLHYMRSRAEE